MFEVYTYLFYLGQNTQNKNNTFLLACTLKATTMYKVILPVELSA